MHTLRNSYRDRTLQMEKNTQNDVQRLFDELDVLLKNHKISLEHHSNNVASLKKQYFDALKIHMSDPINKAEKIVAVAKQVGELNEVIAQKIEKDLPIDKELQELKL